MSVVTQNTSRHRLQRRYHDAHVGHSQRTLEPAGRNSKCTVAAYIDVKKSTQCPLAVDNSDRTCIADHHRKYAVGLSLADRTIDLRADRVTI